MSSNSNNTHSNHSDSSCKNNKSSFNEEDSHPCALIQSLRKTARSKSIKEYKPRPASSSKQKLSKKQVSNLQSAERSRIKQKIHVDLLEAELNEREVQNYDFRQEIIDYRFSIECMHQKIEAMKSAARAKRKLTFSNESNVEQNSTPQDFCLIGFDYDDALSSILPNTPEIVQPTEVQVDESDHIYGKSTKRSRPVDEEQSELVYLPSESMMKRSKKGDMSYSIDNQEMIQLNCVYDYKRLDIDFVSSPVSTAGTSEHIPENLMLLTPNFVNF